MQVANLELCKTLWELSGWKVSTNPEGWHWVMDGQRYQRQVAPAYDLGYLLRKLPETLKHPATGVDYTIGLSRLIDTKKWLADYSRSMLPNANADTPEDATCKLAIELFKQDVLTKGQEQG